MVGHTIFGKSQGIAKLSRKAKFDQEKPGKFGSLYKIIGLPGWYSNSITYEYIKWAAFSYSLSVFQ